MILGKSGQICLFSSRQDMSNFLAIIISIYHNRITHHQISRLQLLSINQPNNRQEICLQERNQSEQSQMYQEKILCITPHTWLGTWVLPDV